MGEGARETTGGTPVATGPCPLPQLLISFWSGEGGAFGPPFPGPLKGLGGKFEGRGGNPVQKIPLPLP
ncbi:MAG: hypothetical protein A2Z73_04950 [Deltaproteobacteria bacterium RBG_13_60_28]|nr:MAG: hypothetical protein A2Z73_04950 [Deltaproteobacteria bacterium RBG_13_60_28]